MNQLAAAHERELINQGSTIHITVDYNTKKATHGQTNLKQDTPTIKLQLIKDGSKKVDIRVDDILTNNDNGTFF